MRKKKPPILQYVCLALLFALASAYQIRSAMYAFPNYFHLKVVAYPFVPEYVNGRPVLQFVTKSAWQAGVQNNDILLAVNGPLTGLAVFGEAIRTTKPGETLTVQVLRPGETAPRSASIQLEQATAPPISLPAASLLALKLVVPTFCILLGFWVTAVRPRDPSAWCLFLIMLFFSVFYSSGVESWGPFVRDVAEAYRVAVGNAWPIFMLLFGVYFPEPFPEKDPAWWTWSKRIVITLLTVSCVMNVIVRLGQFENFALVASLSAALDRLSTVDFLLKFAAIGSFFACISVKMRQAVTPDAKRRLRLLYTGCSIAMAPACILFVTQSIKGGDLEQIFPEWFVLSALSLMLLFPITLAYVIVVHRAMDVRVVIRQGLQYALATGGIRVLQIILTAAVLITGVTFARSHNLSPAREMTTIALLILAVLWLRKGADRLRKWTDRRFFRDAYNAEQILEALSDEVRSSSRNARYSRESRQKSLNPSTFLALQSFSKRAAFTGPRSRLDFPLLLLPICPIPAPRFNASSEKPAPSAYISTTKSLGLTTRPFPRTNAAILHLSSRNFCCLSWRNKISSASSASAKSAPKLRTPVRTSAS